jgi:hypothetical protein
MEVSVSTHNFSEFGRRNGRLGALLSVFPLHAEGFVRATRLVWWSLKDLINPVDGQLFDREIAKCERAFSFSIRALAAVWSGSHSIPLSRPEIPRLPLAPMPRPNTPASYVSSDSSEGGAPKEPAPLPAATEPVRGTTPPPLSKPRGWVRIDQVGDALTTDSSSAEERSTPATTIPRTDSSSSEHSFSPLSPTDYPDPPLM